MGVVYRSPNSSNEENMKLLNQISYVSEKVLQSKSKLLLVGDFNYKEIDWPNEYCPGATEKNSVKFLNCIQKNFLTQFVSSATHKRGDQCPTLIDLIISNEPDFVQNIEHHAPLGSSHHEILTFSIDQGIPPQTIKTPEKYLLEKGDYTAMRKEVGEINWEEILKDSDDVDQWWGSIENVINSAAEKHIPKKKTSKKHIKRSFYAPPSLLQAIQLKRKTYKYYKKYPTEKNFTSYVKIRNIVNREVSQTKCQKEQKIARDAKTNPKALFQYINQKTKPRETVPDLTKPNGELTENSQEKAQVLNEFFGSVFTNEADSEFPDCDFEVENLLTELTVSEDQMFKVLSGLNPSKSPGPDLIHPRVLKELAPQLAHPLTMLFTKTIKHGKIPRKWKVAEVRPIFKKGNKASPNNYRPVSLTSIVCKVFECFVRDALYNHLISNNLLSKDQFGFCQGRSCVTQLLATIHDWMLNLDNKIPTDAVYLDFSKAFDSVPHGRLVHKLKAYGIRGKVLDWVEDFLLHRSQFVSINGSQSDMIHVSSGVPQGSVLGPTLFIYYINDLPSETDRKVRIFADDSKIYSGVSTKEDSIKLQEGIDALVEWSKKWMMKFNADKCKVLHLGRNNPQYTYTMKDGNVTKELDTTICEKDLGVSVDSLLTFDQHVNGATKKGRQMSGMIIRNITYKTPDIMLPLYKAYVRTQLEYANAVWHPYLKKHMHMIEKVQKNYTRRIYGMKGLSYPQRLKKLKLPSMEFRQLRGDMIEVFKYTHNIYDPLSTNGLLTLSSNNITRQHPYKLELKRANTVQFQNFFTNRVIQLWNGLPSDIVCADTVNSFKNKIDKHFLHLIFETDINKYFPSLYN